MLQRFTVPLNRAVRMPDPDHRLVTRTPDPKDPLQISEIEADPNDRFICRRVRDGDLVPAEPEPAVTPKSPKKEA